MTYPIAQLERRFTAFAVDRLLAWSLLAAVGVVTAMFVSDELWTVVGAVAGAAVLLWLVLAIVLGVSGSSPGKAMTGLRVVHHGTGTPIGVGPALLRSLVLGVSGLPTFGIGLATLAWTAVEDRGRQRRGWHDHLTHTVVVDVRPVVEVADARRRGPAPHRQPHRDAPGPGAAGRGGADAGALRAVDAPPAAAARGHPAAARRAARRPASPPPPRPQQPRPQQPPPQPASSRSSRAAPRGRSLRRSRAAPAVAGALRQRGELRDRRPRAGRPAPRGPQRRAGRAPDPALVGRHVGLQDPRPVRSRARRHDRGDGPRAPPTARARAAGRLAPARTRQAGRARRTATRSSTATAR